MERWPEPGQLAVFDPARAPVEASSGEEARLRIAMARVRMGLPTSEELVDEVLDRARGAGAAHPGSLTVSEEQETWGDNSRVERARHALEGAEHVFGRVEVCWLGTRRGIRVFLTGEHDRYRRLLARAVEADRIVLEHARFTERQLAAFHAQLRGDSEDLAAQGVLLSRSAPGRQGLEIEYYAVDHEHAERLLIDRYGAFATCRYQGASRHTLRPHPFGSWLADGNELHMFYALGLNGERPGGCTVHEQDDSVIVALTILDWRGAKTLRGGFTPSHATVQLAAPLNDRAVIDDSANRSRPHWTIAAAATLPRPQDL